MGKWLAQLRQPKDASLYNCLENRWLLISKN
jgi:hypothetical protein